MYQELVIKPTACKATFQFWPFLS